MFGLSGRQCLVWFCDARRVLGVTGVSGFAYLSLGLVGCLCLWVYLWVWWCASVGV